MLIAKEAGSTIAPVEEGTYPATCFGIIDTGIQHSEVYGNSAHKVTLLWELADEFIEIEGKKEPRTVMKTYTLSLNEKASLRKDLVAWRGKEFTPEQLRGFDITSILGQPCLLNIVHSQPNKEGRIYANISGIMKMPKGMAVPVLQSNKILFDLQESPLSMIDTFSEYLQKKIKESETYKDRVGAAAAFAEESTEYAVDELDGDLPF